MLVSMKQNVLERATPRPERRRFRPGIALGVVGLLAIGTATGAVALSLSQQDVDPIAAPTQTQQPEPSPSATTPSSAPITDAPTPTPTQAPPSTVATIPTDCRALVSAADYDRFFGSTPLTQQDPPSGTERVPDGQDREGVESKVSCTWRDPRADISGIEVRAGTATEAVIQQEIEEFPAYDGGGTCAERDGGTFCQSRGIVEPYGVEKAYTYYTRGDTWITIEQTNVPTDGLLPALIATFWGD
ncbi:hypothetical protein BIU97_16740 [Curtobacterium sp. MCBA15_009]|nr:hypothetical protein BIU92_16655 [Curtobacterium sp. MCBA15_003]OII13832.1 hypothetical protein BIU97_16740 [Curtobacterium sp. MCBA15_009]OII33635.1 hypothetical protein BIU94_00680 [Curtobacterium sp. MMLR14_006]